jgi:hypothetical protein
MIGIAGVCSAFITKSLYGFMPYNNVVVICFSLTLGGFIAVPRLAKTFLVIRSRVAAIGTLVLAIAALHANLKGFLHLPSYPFFADERRLLSIENELAVAREIQSSILPSDIPEVRNLRITAAYHPMTAVAGDFYEFIPVDPERAGFLVADVSGHGFPSRAYRGDDQGGGAIGRVLRT